jgi:hypothetical protein
LLAQFSSEADGMLWTIVVILLVLWLLGITLKVTSGLIHLLLVIALIVIVVRLLSGRRV